MAFNIWRRLGAAFSKSPEDRIAHALADYFIVRGPEVAMPVMRLTLNEIDEVWARLTAGGEHGERAETV